MPDTYRPLREDDPVGTEVWFGIPKDDCSPRTLLLRHSQWGVVAYGPHAMPSVELLRHLFVRCPDPWGELLAKAKKVVQLNGSHNELRAAIAAVEAAQQTKEST